MAKRHVVVRGFLCEFPDDRSAHAYLLEWHAWRTKLEEAVAEAGAAGVPVPDMERAPGFAAHGGRVVSHPLVVEDARDASECLEMLIQDLASR